MSTLPVRVGWSLALLAVALGGCGSGTGEPTVRSSARQAEASTNAPLAPSPGRSGAPGPTPKSSAPPRLGQKPTPAPATPPPPPPPRNVDPCQAQHLTIRVVHQPSADPGAMVALVAITNTGTSGCALSGWPTVSLSRNGTEVGVPTTKVNKPRSPVGMVLRNNQTAFAGLHWKACAAIEISCRTGSGLRISAPGADPVEAELLGFPSKQLLMSVMEIGSVQPTTTNIINW